MSAELTIYIRDQHETGAAFQARTRAEIDRRTWMVIRDYEDEPPTGQSLGDLDREMRAAKGRERYRLLLQKQQAQLRLEPPPAPIVWAGYGMLIGWSIYLCIVRLPDGYELRGFADDKVSFNYADREPIRRRVPTKSQAIEAATALIEAYIKDEG